MIQLTIKDVHGSITEAMKDIANDKFAFLEKLTNGGDINIAIAREGKKFKAIAQFSLSGQYIKVESNTEEDAYVAMDELAGKAKEVTQDNRNKLKRVSKIKSDERRESSKKAVVEEEVVVSKIVRRKKFQTKPMTEDGAIGEMEALGHDSFVFMNAELEGKICMLYTRKSGGYGLIELE